MNNKMKFGLAFPRSLETFRIARGNGDDGRTDGNLGQDKSAVSAGSDGLLVASGLDLYLRSGDCGAGYVAYDALDSLRLAKGGSA
jgi:hypothetical protein